MSSRHLFFSAVRDKRVDATGHSYGDPAWRWDGYSKATATFTCSKCAEETDGHTQSLEATGNAITVAHTTVPTCTSGGKDTYTATVTLGDKSYTNDKEKALEATGHDMDAHPSGAATCTAPGNSAYWYCKNCEKYFSDKDGENEIEENSWVIAASHNLTHHEAVEATADTAGNEENWECTECHTHFKDAEGKQPYNDNEWIIPATGSGSGGGGSSGGGGDSGGGGSAGGGGGDEPVVDDIQSVIDMINALTEPYNESKVKAARAAYNELTPEKQAKVTNYKKLTEAEEAIKSAEAQKASTEVINMIKAIPEDLSQSTREQVEAARTAYDALDNTAKQLVVEPYVKTLENAEYFWAKNDAQVQKTKLTSVKAKKGKKAVVKWRENTAADGYLLYYKAKSVKAQKVYINNTKTLKKAVKKLKAGKKYTFKIRTLNNIYNPSKGVAEKVYGKWSNTKRVKARK